MTQIFNPRTVKSLVHLDENAICHLIGYVGLDKDLTGSRVPKHFKVDTKTCLQMFVPYKDAVAARKSAFTRSEYNEWVWNILLDRRKIDRRS